MTRILNKDHYDNYKKKSKNPVSKEIFNSFLYGNNEALYDWRTNKPCSEFGLFQDLLHTIITNAAILNLPYDLGSLCVIKKKYKVRILKDGRYFKKRAIDWKKTKEEGKLTFLDNAHSDEYIYLIKWDKHRHFKHKTYYVFKPSRGFQRYITFMKRQNPQLDFLEDV